MSNLDSLVTKSERKVASNPLSLRPSVSVKSIQKRGSAVSNTEDKGLETQTSLHKSRFSKIPKKSVWNIQVNKESKKTLDEELSASKSDKSPSLENMELVKPDNVSDELEEPEYDINQELALMYGEKIASLKPGLMFGE